MTQYFVDHGAYATNLGAAPTWGVPQEGDGSASTAATASSTVSVVFTANAAATNTVTVCGVVFTAVASGATGNQFNVGAALTNSLANLVAAINASSTAVGATVATGIPQLRNLVFARATSGTTLEIMMRVGSAALNGANNANCAVTASGWASSTSLPALFAGGSGGCWGWLMNPAAIGAGSSLAALSYGVMVAALPICPVRSNALTTQNTPTLNDTIWARTRTSGITIACASNGVPNIGTPNYSHHLVFDTNTIWTGDSGTGQVLITMAVTTTDVTIRLVPNGAGQFKSIRCIRKGALCFRQISSTAGQYLLAPNSSSGSRAAALWQGVIFEQGAAVPSTVGNVRMQGASIFCGVRFKDCDIIDNVARTTWAGAINVTAVDGSIIWEGGSIVNNHTAGGDPGVVVNGAAGAGATIRLIGVQVSGWAFGRYRVWAPGAYGVGAELVAEACTGITLGGYANMSASDSQGPNTQTAVTTSADAGLGFRYEYRAGVVDWNPDAAPAYPTRSALLMDNATPWALKLDWFAATVNLLSNLMTPRLSTMNRLASAVRTVTLDFLSPVTLTTREVVMRLHYIGTDNLARTETTFGLAAALTTPTNTWAGMANYPSHTARRLSITTSAAIKTGTEVAVYLEAYGAPPGGAGIQLYVDPEIGLS
jgi:hypothetical protein